MGGEQVVGRSENKIPGTPREGEKERERDNQSNRGTQGPKWSQKPGRWRPATVARASQTLSEHSGPCSACMLPIHPAAGEGEQEQEEREPGRADSRTRAAFQLE